MRSSTLHSTRRSGVVLLAVLALLTLFAVVAITFVYMSDQQATMARLTADSEIKGRPAPELPFAWGTSQFMFDTPNSGSAMQGQGLASGMYGISGNTPFSGVGRLRAAEPATPAGMSNPTYFCGLFREDMLNFQLRGGMYAEATHGPLSVPYTYPDHNHAWLAAIDGNGQVSRRSFIRGPIKLLRPDLAAPFLFDPFNAGATGFVTAGAGTLGFPIPQFVTFWRQSPITTDPSLGWIDIGLATCRYRPPQPPLPPGAGWLEITPAQARAMTFRPGVWDHPSFGPPDDIGGDAKNFPPGTAVVDAPRGITVPWFGNDSIWMDLGFPIQIGTDSRRYKPLFAFTTIDLDNRVNLNAGGNVWATTAVGGLPGMSMSHHGLGAWEINPFRLLNYRPPGGPTEMVQLFTGRSPLPADIPPRVQGKYGLGATAAATPPGLHFTLWPNRVPYYGRFDADSARELAGYAPSEPFRLPGYDLSLYDTWNYDRFPRYTTKGFVMPAVPAVALGYGSGVPNNGGAGLVSDENRKLGPLEPHPLSHTYFSPQGNNATFPVANIEALLRHGDTGADSLTSDFRRLLLNNMMAIRLRRQVTAHSADLERVGAIPYWHGDQGMAPNGPYQIPPPIGGLRELPPAGPAQTPSLPAGASGEFSASGRSLAANLGKIDLNRLLPEYPSLTPNTMAMIGNIGGRIADAQGFRHATAARQDLAADIFRRLLAVTGAEHDLGNAAVLTPPLPPPPPWWTERINTLRYLAQLAVNIVDHRDYDDYNTPFNFGSTLIALYPNLAGDTTLIGAPPQYSNWVFGTELPRLLINETYAQFSDPGGGAPVDVNVWVELNNTMHRDLAQEYEPDDRFAAPYPYGPYLGNGTYPSYAPGGGVRLHMPESAAGAMDGYSIYKIILANTATGAALRSPSNTHGFVPVANRLTVGGAGTPAIVGDPAPGADEWNTDAVAGGGDWDVTTLPNRDYVHPSNDNISGARRLGGTTDFDTAPDKGFYLLGPPVDFPSMPMAYPPPPTATLRRTEMAYRVTAGAPTAQPTIVLQRLACPHRPEQADPALPNYNPYITVDYFEGVTPRDEAAGPIGSRASIGRTQPYAARRTAGAATAQALLKAQTPDADPPAPAGTMRSGQPQHTFHRHNCVEEVNYDSTVDRDPLIIDYDDNGSPEVPTSPPSVMTPPPGGQTLIGSLRNPAGANVPPLDWLKHLDRDFTSPMELLQVSAFKPHELTQQFMVDRSPAASAGFIGDAANETFQHRVDWFDLRTVAGSSNRLYRIFDYLSVRNRSPATSQVTLAPLGIALPDAANAPGYYEITVPSTAWIYPFASPAGPGPNGGLWEIAAGTCIALNGGTAVRVVPNRPGPMGSTVPTPVTPTTFTVYLPVGLRPPGYPITTLTVTYLNGRVPGKININTVTDLEVFRSLCDASPANSFNPALPVPLPASGLAFGGAGGPLVPGWPLPLVTVPPPAIRIPLLMPAGGITYTPPVAPGDPTYLRSDPGTRDVEWLLRTGDPGAAPVYRGTFLEFNDPVRGRETVEVMAIVDNSGAGSPHYEVHYVPVDHSLNRYGTVASTLNLRLLDHQRNAVNPFPIAVDNVANVFSQLVATRDTLGRPFVGHSAGWIPPAPPDTQYPSGFGLDYTWLRSDPLDPARRLIAGPTVLGAPALPAGVSQPTAVHPERAHDLLSKLANNVTTRSNVFAVWMTVGYFEVSGTGQLGAEIGRADGRHVRHRMFAIVDRTQIDPYVQTVDTYIRALTAGEYSYDISAGAVRDPSLPPPPTYVPNTIASLGPLHTVPGLVGNNQIDPRQPTQTQVAFRHTVTNAVVSSPIVTIPPMVLYWSIIE